MSIEQIGIPWSYSGVYTPTGSHVTETSGITRHTIVNSVNNSAENPNWRDDIKLGNCATTFLTGLKETLSRSPCSFDVANNRGDWSKGQQCDESVPWRASDPSGVSYSALDSRARTKLVKKANEYQRPFQGGIALGELRETLRMLKNPAAALFEGIQRHIKNSEKKISKFKKGTRSYKKVASGLWLESVFGWLPFFSDIESAASALSQLANNASLRRKMIYAYEHSEENSIQNASGETHYSGGDVKCLYRYLNKTGISVRYRAMLQWDSSIYSKFRYFGLTPQDILPTAWELVPWSFLIDYFANIGDIIEGYSFGSSRLRWVDRGVKVSCDKTFGLSYWYPFMVVTDPGSGTFSPENISSSRTMVRREEIINFSPVPDFSFEIPGWRQFANMSALFSSKRGLL